MAGQSATKKRKINRNNEYGNCKMANYQSNSRSNWKVGFHHELPFCLFVLLMLLLPNLEFKSLLFRLLRDKSIK